MRPLDAPRRCLELLQWLLLGVLLLEVLLLVVGC